MYSTTTRITGFSGFDTEGMVKSLMQAESLKYTNLLKKASLTTYRQEAYKGVATTLNTFQSSFLNITGNLSSSIRAVGNFKSMTASVKLGGSDSSAIRVSAGSAKAGTYKITVDSIAAKDQYTGTTAFKPTLTGNAYSFITSEAAAPADGEEPAPYLLKAGDSFNISLDGASSKAITFTEQDIASLENAAAADKDSVLQGILNDKVQKAFGTDSVNGNAYKVSATVQDGKITLNALPGHSLTVYNGSAGTLGALGLTNGKSTSTFNNDMTLGQLLGVSYTEDQTTRITINGNNIELNLNMSVKDAMAQINKEANVNMYFDNNQGKFVLESKSEGAVNAITFGGSSVEANASTRALFDKIGIALTPAGNGTGQLINASSRTSVASDAVITVDGVKTTRENNSFTINGLSITLNKDSVEWVGTTQSSKGEFTITVANDTAPVKKLITDFITAYNNLVENLNSLTRTARPKSATGDYFDPLTDEEKSALSESQVKTWEEKARTGLLYNDSIVEKILSDMRSQLTSALKYTDNDGVEHKISLSSIGITTTNNVHDGGKLMINDEAKLDDALANRSEEVLNLFTRSPERLTTGKAKMATEGLSERLNDIIKGAIDSKGSIYKKSGIEGDANSERDSTLYKELAAQNEKISQMLTYLQNRETYYYNMFSRMEAAMMKADSQLSSIQSILGA